MVISIESRKRLGIGLIPGFFLLLLTFASSAQSIFEQVGRLPVTSYYSEEYGGDPFVSSAIQSEEGLMYFGSVTGIHEYDGVNWRTLLKRNEAITIENLTKDTKGRIFYTGQDFGYLEANKEGETKMISLLHLIPKDIRSNFLAVEIHYLNGAILLRGGSNIFMLQLTEDLQLKSFKSWQSETRFGQLFLVQNEFYVRQAERGLFKLQGEELELIPGTEIMGQTPLSVFLPNLADGGKSLLLGGAYSGFYLLKEGKLSKFPTEVDQLIQSGNQLNYAISHQGNYILSIFGAGIVTMNPKGEILNRIGSAQGLPSDVVINFYVDQNQGLWACTEDGIARIAIDSPILRFGKDLGVTSAVLSIQKTGGDLYLGTNTGLLKFDKDKGEFKSAHQNNNAVIQDLWTDGEDLIVPGLQLNVVRRGEVIRVDGPEETGRPNYALIPKNHPDRLFVSSSMGLSVYQRGLSNRFPWEYMEQVPGVEPGSYIFGDKEGMVFFISGTNIYVIDPAKMENERDDLSRMTVATIESDFALDRFSVIDGEFYLRSKLGMQKYSSTEKKLVPTDDFAAIEKDIYDFNQHKSGVIWYESLDKKKYILKRDANGKFVKDERPNSLGAFLSVADFIDEDSILWFGTPKGLIRYDPKKDNQTDKKFVTLIRRIETKTDTLPLFQYGRNKDIAAVEMKDNSYRFEFAAPQYEEEKKTKYQTYLEGFDADWVDWNDNTFKEYTNLPPGPYTFRVRAMAVTGRISEEAAYSFVVLPPWYATWWAYLLYVLVIGGLITAIVKWRSRKLKAENRILEQRVNERTAALERSLSDLKSTQSQLVHAEKMASLGELTAGIAHEIQNPLNFVNNFSEVSEELIEEMKEEIDRGNYDDVKVISDDLKENLGKIKFHGKRADGIVKSMLQHSRKDSGKKELADINQVADEYLRLSYHGLRAKDKSFFADFHLDADPSLPKVEVIPQEIGRVLLNLINNAFYAASEKKKLLEESGNLGDFKPKVWVITKNGSDGVTISIRDNGNGIPDDIKSKIFQPFFTTKPAGSGTGLGLSMSYDIITKGHQGKLEVESKTGEFTEFTIFLNTKKS